MQSEAATLDGEMALEAVKVEADANQPACHKKPLRKLQHAALLAVAAFLIGGLLLTVDLLFHKQDRDVKDCHRQTQVDAPFSLLPVMFAFALTWQVLVLSAVLAGSLYMVKAARNITNPSEPSSNEKLSTGVDAIVAIAVFLLIAMTVAQISIIASSPDLRQCFNHANFIWYFSWASPSMLAVALLGVGLAVSLVALLFYGLYNAVMFCYITYVEAKSYRQG